MTATLFYICGAVVIASAPVVVLLAVLSDRFPGPFMNLLVAWFVIFGVAGVAFAIADSNHESRAEKIASAEADRAGEEQDEGEEAEEGSKDKELEQENSIDGAGEEMEGKAGATETGGGVALEGAAVFTENCTTCHGATGEGGNGGPSLKTMPLAQSEEGAIQQVTNGGGGMPAFAGVLSDKEIEDVAAYVAQEVTGGEPKPGG